jgi:phage gp36-like protein
MAQTIYATSDDVEDLGLKAINQRLSADPPELTPAQVQKALEVASSEAEGYLSTRYKPPFSVWPESLRLHVAQLAAYYLMTRTGYAPGSEGNELILQGYEMAISWLEKVASGRITLPLHTTSPSVSKGPEVYSEPDRQWDRFI